MSDAPRRRAWTTALKLGGTVVLLAIALRGIDLSSVGAMLRTLGAEQVAAILSLALAMSVLLAVRWWRILAALGHELPLRAVLADSLVGVTYSQILPTAIGGDVVRALRATGRGVPAPAIWASIAVDRALGFVSLSLVPLLALTVLPVAGASGTRTVAALSLAAFVVGLEIAPWPIEGAARVFHRLERVSAALAGVAGALRAVPLRAKLEALAWSLLYQALAAALLLIAAARWVDPAALVAVLIGVPIAFILVNVPISIGGLGLREALFVTLLGKMGMPADHALALSLVWALQGFAIAFCGLGVLARGARPG